MPVKSKKRNTFLVVLFVIFAFGVCLFIKNKVFAPSLKDKEQVSQTSGFNKQAFSTTEPDSIWVVVNKKRPLPSTYVPSQLRKPNVIVRGGSGNNDEVLLREDAAQALEKMLEAAKKDNQNIQMVSGYRSYDLQAIVYDSNVKAQGKAEADKTSARPGHSEHQLGLAADLATTDGKCQIEKCFADTSAAKWLNEHAAEYGFILRYQQGTKPIVGYDYEPWHFRYVGKELAQEVVKSNQTLEEFFGLPPAPNY